MEKTSMARARPSLAGMIELRAAIPPVPADASRPSLKDRFLIPPFSVLDARAGYWQKRKRMWIELGIKSELGRGEGAADGNGLLGYSEGARSGYRPGKANATPGGSLMPAATQRGGKTQRGDGKGRALARTYGSGAPGDLASGYRDGNISKGSTPLYNAYTQNDDVSRRIAEVQAQSGTSIFDPVLCELAYRWFCPPAGRILDPFAGGSVRGIVAASLGRKYAGVDLRPEQVAANHVQKDEICPMTDILWVAGDALDMEELVPDEYDFLFSCPPYFDLERYSDDPRDLSTMEYKGFRSAYRRIVALSCAMLREDRFACFVVGDVRDRIGGNYRGFVGDTIEAFRSAGLHLYNQAVLVTSCGSLPIRVGKQFAKYRKLGATHQHVLVFLKGDAGRAAAACGPVDIDDLEMPAWREHGVAICAQDVAGLEAEGYFDGDGSEVPVIDAPLLEAALLCDIARGEARAAGNAIPRVWVAAPDGWSRVGDHQELTYLVGGTPYLSRDVFPEAAVPTDRPPVPRRLRG